MQLSFAFWMYCSLARYSNPSNKEAELRSSCNEEGRSRKGKGRKDKKQKEGKKGETFPWEAEPHSGMSYVLQLTPMFLGVCYYALTVFLLLMLVLKPTFSYIFIIPLPIKRRVEMSIGLVKPKSNKP